MHQGHHGANHPVKDLTTGRSNHLDEPGFAVDKGRCRKMSSSRTSRCDGSFAASR
jgi:carbamoyl-phosphate synthase small subunit